MVKLIQQWFALAIAFMMLGCVSQNFENDTPVVQNSSSINDIAMTRISLGLGYLKMGNYSQAKFNLEKAKGFAPNLVEVYTAFAHYYETVGEPELTIKAYNKALLLRADDANTLNNYGVYLCRQAQYPEAEIQFLKAIAVPSYLRVSESYENLASCQLKANNFDKAEQYLAKAAMHSPNSDSVLFQLIRLEYAMGNYIKARTYTQRFEKITRRFKPEYLALAMKVYRKLGNRKAAKNYANMLVKMFVTSWQAKQYLLNGLKHIEADDLAEQYQKLRQNEKVDQPKKRVIVLSPRDNTKRLSPEVVVNTVQRSENKLTELDSQAKNENVNRQPISYADKVPAVAIEQEIASIPESQVKNSVNTVEAIVTPVQDSVGVITTLEKETSVDSVETIAKLAQDKVISVETVSVSNSKTDATSFASSIKTLAPVFEADTNVVLESPTEQQENTVPRTHVVTKGDNLFMISMKYNIQMKSLRRWNQLGLSSKIRVGDTLYLTDPMVVEQTDD